MLCTAEMSPLSCLVHSNSYKFDKQRGKNQFSVFCIIYDLCPYITRHSCLFLHCLRSGWLTLPNLPSFIVILPVLIPSWNQIFPDSSIIQQLKWKPPWYTRPLRWRVVACVDPCIFTVLLSVKFLSVTSTAYILCVSLKCIVVSNGASQLLQTCCDLR